LLLSYRPFNPIICLIIYFDPLFPTLRDVENSFFMPINEQLAYVCQKLLNDSRFNDGIHLIGLSQGGLFVRALAQRCPLPRIGAVVSIGGPQKGIYGFPRCPEQHLPLSCSLLRALLNYWAYSEKVQAGIVQAQYWHDPLRENLYKEKSLFLAEINQEKVCALASIHVKEICCSP
uniref:Palmitoyl-protein thioesterase 1 n=1 Tax=Echinostoma caproni TaxID=27848 RepID=A0A183AD39_9TREM